MLFSWCKTILIWRIAKIEKRKQNMQHKFDSEFVYKCECKCKCNTNGSFQIQPICICTALISFDMLSHTHPNGMACCNNATYIKPMLLRCRENDFNSSDWINECDSAKWTSGKQRLLIRRPETNGKHFCNIALDATAFCLLKFVVGKFESTLQSC